MNDDDLICERCGLSGAIDIDTGGYCHAELWDCINFLRERLAEAERELEEDTGVMKVLRRRTETAERERRAIMSYIDTARGQINDAQGTEDKQFRESCLRVAASALVFAKEVPHE